MVRRKGMYGVSCEAEKMRLAKYWTFLAKKNKKTIEMQTKKILNVLKMQTKSTVVYYGILKKKCRWQKDEKNTRVSTEKEANIAPIRSLKSKRHLKIYYICVLSL